MISVCIATYNGEKYIREQLLSILPQLNGDDEVVISDDGSTDATLSVVQDIQSPRIRVVRNNGPHGFAPNFQNAILRAKGDYIFLCDQDDVWLPNKVEVSMQALQDYDMVISDARVTDAALNVKDPSYWHYRNSNFSLIGNLIRFSHIGCCIAFRRAVLAHALPLPGNHSLATHDNWIGLVGMTFYRLKYIPTPLILFRRHDSNTSRATEESANSAWFKIKYRLYLTGCLVQRAFTAKRHTK